MPRRMILTDADRQNFLALPTDDDTLIRHWSLDDNDCRLIETRRHGDTRLGLVLQLCAVRYPGRLIQCGEIIPWPLSHFWPSSSEQNRTYLQVSHDERPPAMSNWLSSANITGSAN